MKRWPVVLLLSTCLLLSACQMASTSSVPEPVPVTELQHGTITTSVDGQISGETSPENGAWLLLTVHNEGDSGLLLTVGRDTEHGVAVAPGETGCLSHSLGTLSHSYEFQIYPANPGQTLQAAYTLTQSTISPDA